MGLLRLVSPATVVGVCVAPARALLAGRRCERRRVWVGEGRAHVEAAGIDQPGSEPLAVELERRLEAVEGVDRASVNGVLGRVVVEFDAALVTVEDLAAVVEDVEVETQTGTQPATDGAAGRVPSHPGDAVPVIGPALGLAADVAALGLSVTGRMLRTPPLPVAIPWALSLVDWAPGVRSVVDSRVGRRAADCSLAVSRVATLGLAQGYGGILVDAAHRTSLLTEARARRNAWSRIEPGLARGRVPAVERRARPVALPASSSEAYTKAASFSALAAYGTTLGLMRDPFRAFGFMVAATPTAARLGTDAFAAQMGRSVARRNVLVMDPDVLRRLDRVDVTVLDASAVLTGRHTIDDVRALNGVVDAVEVYQRAHELVDVCDVAAFRQANGWSIAPVGVPRRAVTPGGPRRRRAAPAMAMRPTRLVLTCDEIPVGEVSVVPELDPLAEELVAAARRTGDVRMAGGSAYLRQRLGIDATVGGGRRLRAAVEELQASGHVVALVSAGTPGADEALAAADCGIGVLSRPRATAGATDGAAAGGADGATVDVTPWAADVICARPGVAEACTLLSAVPAARTVSRRSAAISFVGSAGGVLLAVAGPGRGAARRATVAVDAAAALAMGSAAWSAATLGRDVTSVLRDGTPWHALPTAAVLKRLGSRTRGLTVDEADRRLAARASLNGSTTDKMPGLVRASLEELANPLTPTLSAAAGVSAVTGSIADAMLITTVLGVTALIGGAQRVGADRALKRLADTSAVRVRVRRDEGTVQVPAARLVPGDVVELHAGDSVPADCRLLQAKGLELDESSVTGESALVAKTPQPTLAAAVADRHSMLYEGTAVAAGTGTAVVVATGMETELGQTTLATVDAPRPGGVEVRLRSLTRRTLPICIGAGAAIIAAGAFWRRPTRTTVATGISLAVAAVPEGLPFVATVAQLAAATRLSRRNALVRKPATIEALGRVDVLCFDKTGTLTQGRIALRRVSDGCTDQAVDDLSPAMQDVLAAGLRASPRPSGERPLAHPTDQAVVTGGAHAGVQTSDGLDGWSLVAELPFEPARGFHAVLGRCGQGHRLSVKGAPEVVLPLCTSWQRNGGAVDCDAAALAEIEAEVDRLARGGYRVLAVADRLASGRADLAESRVVRLRFLGLLALADPVRPSAAEAVAQLTQAGVDVVMVTGDHPSTAESIAAELDLLDGRAVMTGPELDALDDDAVCAVLPDVVVFARTSPAQKVRIVDLLRRTGRVVAVTGDGANDAPAIRMADVGIALGERATNATKQAADVVITDDRIETITDAVVEGRGLWVSVRDALAILLGGNLGEIAFTLATGMATRGGSAVNARQLLLVNLLTDMLPAMAIAAGRPTKTNPDTLLREGPDASLGGALTRDIIIRAVATAGAAGAAWTLGRMTGTRAHAGTVALVALVAAQLGQTLAVARPSRTVLAACVVSFAALAVTVQVPGVSHFFGCRPLGPTGWAFGLGSATAATLAAVVASRTLQQSAPPPHHG